MVVSGKLSSSVAVLLGTSRSPKTVPLREVLIWREATLDFASVIGKLGKNSGLGVMTPALAGGGEPLL